MARLNILRLRAVAPEAPAAAPAPVPDIPVPVQAAAPETLCRGCAVAHIAVGSTPAEETILCGLNGWLRDLPFPVTRCTDYRKRGKRSAEPIGFGRIE
jgi:hypothetical protein